MKKFIFITFLLCNSNSIFTQDSLKKSRFYIDLLGIGPNNYSHTLHHSVNYINRNMWGLSISIDRVELISKNEEYILNYNLVTTNYSHNYSLLLTKLYKIGNEKKILQIGVGLSCITYVEVQRLQYTNSTELWFWGSTLLYKNEQTTQNTIGLNLRITMIKPRRRFVGTNIALTANINKFLPYVGLVCNVRLGK